MNAWWLSRLWDVGVGTAPLAASALAGALLIAWSGRKAATPLQPTAAWVLGLGCAAVQGVTWMVALFAGPMVAAAWHWLVFGASAAAFAIAFAPRPAGGFLDVLRRWPLRAGLLLAPLLAFVLANPREGGQLPSDALAYHIPAANWFALGGAWRDLPGLLWTAQLPLASSLWTSLAIGARIPVIDPLTAWVSVGIAMVTWTGIVFWDVVARPSRAPWLKGLAALGGLALVGGAYTAQSGFVDYAAGLLAVCLVGVLGASPDEGVRPWMVVSVAAALGECRPQGLILAVSLLAAWPAVSRTWESSQWLAPRRLPGLLLAAVVGAKWWALVWWRWGTPFVPILGARLGASPEVANAERVYRESWPPATLPDAVLYTLGPSGVPAVAVAAWSLLLLAAVLAWRTRGMLRTAPLSFVILPAALAPIAGMIFLAGQNPTQAARMIVVSVPALALLGSALARTRGGDDRVSQGALGAACVLLLAALLMRLPDAWSGDRLRVGEYPSPLGRFHLALRDQLTALGERDACILNQYGAALTPPGHRFLGGLPPPWARLPERLGSAEDWVVWLRQQGVRAVVTQPNASLAPMWMGAGAPSNADPAALDRWVQSCPGQRRLASWVTCPLAP